MWPFYLAILKRYAPMVTFPFAIIVGFVGYHVEGYISDSNTASSAPILQQREERLLENIDSNSTKTKHNPLEINLSKSLL